MKLWWLSWTSNLLWQNTGLEPGRTAALQGMQWLPGSCIEQCQRRDAAVLPSLWTTCAAVLLEHFGCDQVTAVSAC